MIAQEQRQFVDVVNGLIKSALSRVHTIAVVKVTSIAADKKTIGCRIVWNLVHADGSDEKFCEFQQVPPICLGGGTDYLAFKGVVGDYGLLFITERCWNRWWTGNDFQAPASPRMHDYSDGFCLIGLKPLAEAIAFPDKTTLKGPMRLGTEHPADSMALAGKVLMELQALRTDLEAFKTLYNGHAHGGVTTGTGTSAVPATPATPGSGPNPVASLYVEAD